MLILELLAGIREDFSALGQLGDRDGVNRRAPERRHRAVAARAFPRSHDHVIQEFNLQDSVALTLNSKAIRFE